MSTHEVRKQVLGRGLSSLLEASQEVDTTPSLPIVLPLDMIVPGVHQPRQFFPHEELEALSASIREKGVLQPILVRSHPEEKGKYEIIAGERRWRAAQQAGLQQIPILIKELSDIETLEVGLLENIQRQDLNPIEEADGYRRLAEEFGHTQESLARILGKSRSHIANILRLLTLPKKVQDYINEGKLTAGHGRAIVNAENPELLAELIIQKDLSVRQAESLAKQKLDSKNRVSTYQHVDPEKEILCQHLSTLLGTSIELILKGQGGKIIIPFDNPAELDLILQKLNMIC
ncbi:MAG: ParB/RepB/Spo0J family partition protein [Proteobacteria bacterium]|nr:ParB/RepB/Spo0J family partition protein [Pseudomonadota bacterium]